MTRSDIVERLREAFQRKRYGSDSDYDPDFDRFDVAADEIERLAADNKRLRAMLFRARDYIAGERTKDRPRDAMLERIDRALEPKP